jgi:two-component system response regulator GlrR
MMKTPTILLVEDELQQREALEMLLDSEGYKVLAMDSAEQALETVSREHPTMIVTDVKLPDMDGITMFEQVREKPQLQHIPFIFITGYNDPDAIVRLKTLGGVGYVTKPYDLEVLLEMIKKFLPSHGIPAPV